MEVIQTRKAMQQIVENLRSKRQTLGFIPTMGYLHEGHLSLVKRARVENTKVIVSIFINPTQFSENEDYETYPRDLEHDKEMLQSDVDYLFVPDKKELYLENEKITFEIKDLADCLCGKSRPHHFSGVCLVLTKLFHIIQPHSVYFGQKDYQQTVIVSQLLKEFFFPVEMMVSATFREPDGLAMSSRNVYLSPEERLQAVQLYQSLQLGLDLLQKGERNSEVIIQKVQLFLKDHGISQIDYIEICDSTTLEKIPIIDESPIVLALAAFFDKTRLIDNVLYSPYALTK